MAKSEKPGPIPFVKELSWTGELKVGWSTSIMSPSGDPSKIPLEKVAIESIDITDETRGRSLDAIERKLVLNSALGVNIL